MIKPTSAPSEYDCFVLSGGGAKGAYGAGVAKAIELFRRLRGLTNPVVYVGASAGALNAYILASGGADDLIKFWLEIDNQRILGTKNKHPKLAAAVKLGKSLLGSSEPFSLYTNTAIKKLVAENATLDRLHSPLIVATTDYSTGTPKAFYRSDLIDGFLHEDGKIEVRKRRLKHLRRIENDEMLVQALVASAAIPIIFPPVEISSNYDGVPEKSWFVDGGVGNNTPTREAAYFNRFLEQSGLGIPRVAFCVKLDNPTVFHGESDGFDFVSILMRTMDVFSWVHMKPIVDGWNRINREVEEQNNKVDRIAEWIQAQDFRDEQKSDLTAIITEEFKRLGGPRPRVAVPLIEIEPSVSLGDVLNFAPKHAAQNITHGYNDALRTLRDRPDPRRPGETMIDEAEHTQLRQTHILPA
ncbi:patatin-like phospholipase family protein [Caulobacter sp. NIBR1757]|uniref:patatin-like phospholipase family protein n=1 Tax=Caulobacter sp. NIBR1757 TaxID=3016000 RepID=UPI0022F0EA5A|nr:patatin-like phospholipase family protein [Caulobacter sp. NIBR1757]WGM38953.1 hypothetical protein AMEJIAPC_01863 [Caulobacter sp. NIBR1757]